MTIDASAVARGLGIETQYQDMRAGRVLFLPQQIAVFAPGAIGRADYSLEKWLSTSAGAAGQRYGFGSPIHLILRELQPVNGDGVGTIPVYVYPLENDEDGAPAEGAVGVSGTAVRAASYRVRIAGILSEAFVIPAGAIDATRTNADIAKAINAVLEMPVSTTHTYGTVTSVADGDNTGNGTVTVLSAPADPRPGAWTLECNTAVANGGVFTLTDPDGTVVSNAITMTPGVGAATVVNAGGVRFTLTAGSTDFAVGDRFTITVPATDTRLVAKWHGESGNGIAIEVVGDLDNGVSFEITELTGGLVNPSVIDAISRVGATWITMALNSNPIEDTVALDAFQTWGDGRWGELTRKPCVVFTGVTHTSVAEATAVSSGRRTDRVNAQLVAPASPNLPFVVAARQLARIAAVANRNPPTDYGSQRATGLVPGDEADQWDYVMRDQAVKAGSSTIEVRDGVINIADVVTFYRPTGEEPPAYRFVKDIVRLQNCLYNLDLAFSTPEWDGAPLIPDDQATANPNARKPSAMKALAASIVDDLALQAIISDPATTKKNISVVISSQNPNRMDLVVPVQLSGNTNIKSVLLKFGFYFGAPLVLS